MAQEMVAVTAVTAAGPVKVATQMASLAPGVRFHPTDEELVMYYLRRKVLGKPLRFEAVTEIDVYKSEPWKLPAFSSLKTRDLEWYFFSPVDKKTGDGSRLNRATGQGYWKVTGKDRPVRHQSQIIGMKKTLIFHTGRLPDGKKTNWVMHEYRLTDEELGKIGVPQEKDVIVLCRILQKSGHIPAKEDRYAPFIDEEWDDGAALLVPGGEAEEEIAKGDETQVGGNDLGQVQGRVDEVTKTLDLFPMAGACPLGEREAKGTQDTKRKGPEEIELELELSLAPIKRLKPDEPSCSHAKGSDDPAAIVKDPPPMTSAFAELPLLGPANPLEIDPEKFLPPGYVKCTSGLEKEILKVSTERESLKIELMRAQSIISVLLSRIETLNDENDNLKKCVGGG